MTDLLCACATADASDRAQRNHSRRPINLGCRRNNESSVPAGHSSSTSTSRGGSATTVLAVSPADELDTDRDCMTTALGGSRSPGTRIDTARRTAPS